MHLIDLITVHWVHFKTCTNYWQTNEEHHKKAPPFVKCFHYVIPDPRPNKLQRKFIVFLHVLQDFWLQHQLVTSWSASIFRRHLETPTIKWLSSSDHLWPIRAELMTHSLHVNSSLSDNWSETISFWTLTMSVVREVSLDTAPNIINFCDKV